MKKMITMAIALAGMAGVTLASGSDLSSLDKQVRDYINEGGFVPQAAATIDSPGASASCGGLLTFAGSVLSNQPGASGSGDTSLSVAVGLGQCSPNSTHAMVTYHREGVRTGDQQSAGFVVARGLMKDDKLDMAVHLNDIFTSGKAGNDKLKYAVSFATNHVFKINKYNIGATLTAGVGNGALAFVSSLDQSPRSDATSVFGAVAIRPLALNGLSIIGDFSDYATSYGLSAAPFMTIPMVCTLAHVDVDSVRPGANVNGPSNSVACTVTLQNKTLGRLLSF